MARTLSPIFIGRRTVLSHQDGDADETAEIDFRLGQGQAIELFTTQLHVPDVVPVGTDSAAFQTGLLEVTLHRRVGTLVNISPAAAVDELQYEVLHHRSWRSTMAQVAAESTQYSQIIDGPAVVDHRDGKGNGLLLAGNMTLQVSDRGALTGSMTWNHPGVYFKYRYVLPTDKELTQAFFGRA